MVLIASNTARCIIVAERVWRNGLSVATVVRMIAFHSRTGSMAVSVYAVPGLSRTTNRSNPAIRLPCGLLIHFMFHLLLLKLIPIADHVLQIFLTVCCPLFFHNPERALGLAARVGNAYKVLRQLIVRRLFRFISLNP